MQFLKKEDNNSSLVLTSIARFLFFSLLVFELLNVFKIIRLNTQFTWFGLLITATSAFILLEVVAQRYRQNKGHRLHWIVWIIVVLALSLDAAGDFFFLYGRFDWWDRVVHYGVSAITCFTLFSVINAFWIDRFEFSLLFKKGKLKLALFLAATSTISLSAIYEIEEYTEDLLFHTNRLGPGVDTADDLFFNVSGVLTVVILISIYYLITKRRKIID